MADNQNHQPGVLYGAEARQKLKHLIENIQIAMLTTQDGILLRSRPMGTIKAEFNGEVWFFTSDDSPKVDQVQHESQVNIAYSSGEAWVSVSGRARIVHDRVKMEELWNPVLKAWFPDGLETPNICLLCVTTDQAEYWESDGKVAQTIGLLKALVTGEQSDAGENAKLVLN